MNLNACGCCEPAAKPTPVTIDNRPGLSAIAYRIGTYSAFRQAMLQAIAGTPELAHLRTRLSDDYAITVLELWATVADVLTFYQERIANEGFLRTARLRDSVLRMARLIDYQLGPGAAATTLLAFTLEKSAQVKIPVGLRVQSVPGQDEKPQKFETLEAIAADARLNRLRIVPAPVGVNPLAKGNTEAFLAPGADGLAVAEELVPGDRFLLFQTGPSGAIEELEVREVRTDHDRVVVSWSTPIHGASWDVMSRAFKFKRTFRLFGYNAPEKFMMPSADPSSDPVAGGIKWELRKTSYVYPGGVDLALDARYEEIAVGSRLLVSIDGVQNRLVTVTAIGQALSTVGPISDTVTQLVVSPTLPSADQHKMRIYELASPPIRFWGYTYPTALKTGSVYLPGRRIDEQRIEVGRTIDKKDFQPGTEIGLKEIELGRRVLLEDAQRHTVATVINAVTLYGAEVTFAATPADPTTASELGLTADQAQAVTGLVSMALDPFPVITNSPPRLSVRIGRVGPRTATLAGQPADVADAASQLETALHAADAHTAFAAARVLVVDNRLLVLPGIVGASITFAPTADDTTSALELGLDAQRGSTVTGLISARLGLFPVLTSATPELSVAIGVNTPHTLRLALPLANVGAVAAKLEESLNSADLAPAFSQARVLSLMTTKKITIKPGQEVPVFSTYLLVLPGIVGAEIQEYLKIDLEAAEKAILEARSAVLLGNVARASHGETVKEEILGDGDAAAKFQRFSLQKKPLTYVPSADPGGLRSSLRVLVNRMLWKEVPSLYGQAATSQVHTTRIGDDGTVTIQFGDNATGAAAFSGRGNVMAVYRHGLGLAGRVRANTLTTLLDRPVGLKSATNPMSAEGGADPETLDEARENAPFTVRTFGRAVSLRDFEDLVRATGEVAKAKATWVWSGEARAVHLTVAGQEAATFSIETLSRIHASLNAARDPNHLLFLGNFVRVPVVIAATLHVSDAHVASDVEEAARTALLGALSFEALQFGLSIHLSDIYRVLQEVTGVVWVDIDLLHFKDRSPAYLAARGADDDPVQGHLRIYPARSNPSPLPLVLPAEQAWIEAPTQDVTLLTSGGLPA